MTGFDVAKDIKAPFLGLYGEKDQGPSPADATKFGDLLKQTNKNVEIVIYPDAGHGFFADYRPSYNAAAAADAWKRCTAFFDKWLKAYGTSEARRTSAMPFVNIRIYEGWGKERKDEIARRVTEAITDVTKLPKEAVWVVVEEVDPPDWYVAGKPGERMKK